LLALYQSADFAAFDHFYRRNERLIFYFLLARLGNRGDADDASQETFLRLHGALMRYDPKQSALAWVMTIARNASTDILRRRRRSEPRPPADFDLMPAHSTAVDVALACREELNIILSGLSATDRALIEARLLDEDSYADIAAKEGTNQAQVRQRWSRLLKRLRT